VARAFNKAVGFIKVSWVVYYRLVPADIAKLVAATLQIYSYRTSLVNARSLINIALAGIVYVNPGIQSPLVGVCRGLG
jgi:hypothetical protein